ncbi:MAG TPA: FlgD immunoglobulin-like domain containing protein [Gemmatimonadales bacterium]|nr:FlgD immunoglobulin-like domain containing protein [Gemmatimonadales bacterium]
MATFRGSFTGSSLTWQRGADAIPFLSTAAGYGPDHLQLQCDPSGSPLYLTYLETVGDEGTVKVVRSQDGALTWTAPVALSGNRCDHSRAALGPEGELYVMWLDSALGEILGRKSTDQGASFGEPFVVGAIENNLLFPPGWEASTSRYFSTFPYVGRPLVLALAVDGSDTATRGRLYAAWSERASGVPAPPTGGVQEVEPNDTPGTATPMAIGQSASGSMVGHEPYTGDCDWFQFEGQAGTTLWMTGHACGSSLGNPLTEWGWVLWCGTDTLPRFPLAGTRIPCSQNRPALVYTLPASGRYYVDLACMVEGSISYSFSLGTLEISPSSVARDHRDIVLTASGDGGASWSPKVRVNDDTGYDNALPAVAVDYLGRVHVAWYDRREEPECSAMVHTRWTYSEDGGLSFAPSARLSAEGVNLRAINQGGSNSQPWVVGDYMALEAIGREVHAFWAQPAAPLPKRFYPSGDLWSAVIHDLPTATLVRGFHAEAQEALVRLSWELREATGVRGFRVHRASGASAEYLPLSAAAPLPHGDGEYQAEDRDVQPGRRYRYRLEVMTEAGSVWAGPVEVELPPAVTSLRWQGAAPNPFTDSIELELVVPVAARALVSVYDIAGHEIKRLHMGPLPPGLHALRWDGRDRRGRMVPAGAYLVRAAIAEVTVSRRVVRIE